MKRFLLFVYPDYYPSGGMCDFAGDFDTLEAALKYLADSKDSGAENYHIWDSEKRCICESNLKWIIGKSC